MFWECSHVVHFWRQFSQFVNTKYQNVVTTWGIFDIIFGNPLFEAPLNLMLIKGKQFIYSMKLKKVLPTLEVFKTTLFHLFHTEEYIAKKKLDSESFKKKWEDYHALFH